MNEPFLTEEVVIHLYSSRQVCLERFERGINCGSDVQRFCFRLFYDAHDDSGIAIYAGTPTHGTRTFNNVGDVAKTDRLSVERADANFPKLFYATWGDQDTN